MSEWKPIESRDALGDLPEHIVVGWWFNHSDIGRWWEISDDWNTPCATHYCILPSPPEQLS